MKKGKMLIVALIMLASMASLIASPQAEAPAASSPRVVTFWSLFTGGDGEFFDAIIEAFNASHTDIQLKNDMVKFDDYYTKLTAALAAGNAPDLVVCHQGNMLPYVEAGQLLALDDYLKEINAPLNDFVQPRLRPAALMESSTAFLSMSIQSSCMSIWMSSRPLESQSFQRPWRI